MQATTPTNTQPSPEFNFDALVEFFSALSQPTRNIIVHELQDAKRQAAIESVASEPNSREPIEAHIKVLETTLKAIYQEADERWALDQPSKS